MRRDHSDLMRVQEGRLKESDGQQFMHQNARLTRSQSDSILFRNTEAEEDKSIAIPQTFPPNNNITVYACPYYPKNTPEIQALPSGVGRLILAFGGPDGPDGSICTTSYMFSTGRTEQGLIQGIQQLKQRGVKVGLSILDNETHQWPKVNLPGFLDSLKALIQKWELDFVDMDAESSTATAQDFINVVQGVQQICQVPVTYTTYSCSDTDKEVLNTVGKSLERIQTMSYSNVLADLKSAYRFYAQFGPPVAIGVKQQDTSFETAVLSATWDRPDGAEKMSMIWNLNRQGPRYNPEPAFAYIQTMVGLHSQDAGVLLSTIRSLPENLKEACLMQALLEKKEESMALSEEVACDQVQRSCAMM